MYPTSHPASAVALASSTTASARARIAAAGAKFSVHGLAGRLDRGRVLQPEQPMIQAAASEQAFMGAAPAERAPAHPPDAAGTFESGEGGREQPGGAGP